LCHTYDLSMICSGGARSSTPIHGGARSSFLPHLRDQISKRLLKICSRATSTSQASLMRWATVLQFTPSGVLSLYGCTDSISWCRHFQ
jgi:hypothetical protein